LCECDRNASSQERLVYVYQSLRLVVRIAILGKFVEIKKEEIK